MRIAMFVLVAMLGMTLLLNAQGTSITQGMSGKIQKFASATLTNSSSSSNCGQYFIGTGISKDGPTGVLGFIFETFDGTGAKRPIVQYTGVNTVQIHKVPGLTTPVATVLRPKGPVMPWIEISISPEDFAQAPCLQFLKIV